MRRDPLNSRTDRCPSTVNIRARSKAQWWVDMPLYGHIRVYFSIPMEINMWVSSVGSIMDNNLYKFSSHAFLFDVHQEEKCWVMHIFDLSR
jgi:hypothetical protein